MNKELFISRLAEVLEVEADVVVDDAFELNEDNFDSVAVLGVIALVDEEFDITVPTADLNACRSVGDIVNLVARRRAFA
jgi:acyl carrier protein